LATGIPTPLCFGAVEVTDGGWVTGFIGEASGTSDTTNISLSGGWKAWQAENNDRERMA